MMGETQERIGAGLGMIHVNTLDNWVVGQCEIR